MTTPQLLTVDDVALLLHVSRSRHTVSRQSGTPPAQKNVRIWQFPQDEFEEYL